MSITLSNDEIMLGDGTKVHIGVKHFSVRELQKAIVRAVYKREQASGKSNAQAEMETALLTGYETQRAIGKIIRNKA